MRAFSFLFSLVFLHGIFASHDYLETYKRLDNLVSLVKENQMSVKEALLEIHEMDMELLLKPSIAFDKSHKADFSGLVACRGASSGVICFDSEKLESYRDQYGTVIWVTNQINNDDLCYIQHADGICAFDEDPSSHAIIVTRVSNIPCITLLKGARLTQEGVHTQKGILKEGDIITVDAFNGVIYTEAKPIVHPSSEKLLGEISKWCDQYATISVHANADTALESKEALLNGALGVDPRSEHMFFHPDSLKNFRKVILQKELAIDELEQLKDLQKQDILKLFQVMKTYPVKLRLLDPPLHEFLPSDPSLCQELADELGITREDLQSKIRALEEVNPMMGHRGVRLLLTFPEILEVQVKAVFEAMTQPSLEGIAVEPVIVIPMVASENEVIHIKRVIERICHDVSRQFGKTLPYKLGVMIETPRACLIADEIAKHVSYFSFGTNDLTALTFGFSRGDVFEKFLQTYLHSEILNENPFVNLDPTVLRLMEIAVEKSRMADHPISIGICGEQASEKMGVFSCHQIGLDSVSAAPGRIPVVKLFAAQAAILFPSNE